MGSKLPLHLERTGIRSDKNIYIGSLTNDNRVVTVKELRDKIGTVQTGGGGELASYTIQYTSSNSTLTLLKNGAGVSTTTITPHQVEAYNADSAKNYNVLLVDDAGNLFYVDYNLSSALSSFAISQSNSNEFVATWRNFDGEPHSETITIDNVANAINATYAQTAGQAANANYATNAGYAESAGKVGHDLIINVGTNTIAQYNGAATCAVNFNSVPVGSAQAYTIVSSINIADNAPTEPNAIPTVGAVYNFAGSANLFSGNITLV